MMFAVTNLTRNNYQCLQLAYWSVNDRPPGDCLETDTDISSIAFQVYDYFLTLDREVRVRSRMSAVLTDTLLC